MELIRTRDPVIPFQSACEVLAVPRGTARRLLAPPVQGPRRARPPSPRRFTEAEKQTVLDTLHSERFQDQTPRQAYAELLDEGTYLASVSSMYRLLAAEGETTERRNQRVAHSHAIPRLVATRPHEVWTWDVSKLATHTPGVFLNLYLVLDLFSRYPIAWMVAERENSALAKQLIAEAFSRHQIAPGTVTIHNDRGAPMTAIGFIDLLGELGIQRSLSRPRVSNDNPVSESCFKTIKYQPDYPGRFRDLAHARQWLADFFAWYANHHRHSGLALFTPADVFFGRVEQLAAKRRGALGSAFEAHPQRFVRGRPLLPLPPAKVCINPMDPTAPLETGAGMLANSLPTPPQPSAALCS
jgi:putative transposase